ncbi:MAG TPA: putative sulfate exporter family transporter, partial [Tepidisphaeraceae bacterium]
MTTYATYSNSDWAESLDSLEGVPDIFEPRVRPSERGAFTQICHDVLNWVGTMLPGVGLAFLLAFLGYLVSDRIGLAMKYDLGKSPISPITLAVLLGLLIRNTIGVPKTYEAGLRLCIKTVLRLGIVILGLTLSVKALGHDVLVGLPVIVCCIACALVVITLLNKALGLPRRLGTLIAVGTSICGVSAIVATAPIIDAEEDETSYAVACITIFGLVALISYPFLAHALFGSHYTQAGTFLGTAIHDTSQVAGAGTAYAQQYKAEAVLKTAVTVKLVRNLSMSVLIPLMAVLYRRGEKQGGKRVKQPWHQIVPLFVIGFFVMACVRSLGDLSAGSAFGFIPHENWKNVDALAKFYAPWCLATALGAVGLGTGLSKLRSLGLKPFTVGLAAALL